MASLLLVLPRVSSLTQQRAERKLEHGVLAVGMAPSVVRILEGDQFVVRLRGVVGYTG